MQASTFEIRDLSAPGHPWRRREGYTLLEILVALVIMFTLTAIGTVAFVSFIPKIRLSSATNELSFALQRSRLLAIRENRPVKVHFENTQAGADSTGYFESCYINAAGDCVDQAGDPLGAGAGIYLVFLPQDANIFLLDNTFGGDEVIFNNDGTVETTGHIRLGIWEDVARTNLRYSSEVKIDKLDGSRVEVTPPEANPMNPNVF